ncbi:glycosyltransferase family 76 protein [Postia placenta MAD-698-R-SB12]|uniref:GPI mannosyltransferase 2 n=1 Tax=Postia placenta MAD-698-R-SB12 TaxID=670580 RepID=A0A1X6NDI7_9APHY|nr:glycosyltransferase family 76 protein [Postia placenta MAD-698-R-SB12]OSX66590.1 glycosyltransferase family 76 protein [Postia placenta MAD-698-R-SB12]
MRTFQSLLFLTLLFATALADPHGSVGGDVEEREIGPSNVSVAHTLGQPALRWDTFHFAHIAQYGYVYEHERAFMPGTPMVMRAMLGLLRVLGISSSEDLTDFGELLLGAILVAFTCHLLAVTCLYRLTIHHLQSPTIALLVSLLSLLPSSPATLRIVPYTEPFFTYLSYQGMLFCARSQWMLAACCFAAAGTFRSNGILLSGFIIWGILVEPYLARRKTSPGRVVYTIYLVSLVFLPFVAHQYIAYRDFCLTSVAPAPWCNRIPPSIYSYVQAKYWNSGFMRYWTPQQLPNFLISAPVLVLLLGYSVHHIRRALIPRLQALLSSRTHISKIRTLQSTISSHSPFLSPSVAPHAIHAFIFTLMLLFTAHTQIVLRLAASMPFTYWAAAWLLVEHPLWGKRWVTWSVVWGAVSVVLWATFMPPA